MQTINHTQIYKKTHKQISLASKISPLLIGRSSCPQQEIADHISMSRQEVSRSINILVKKKVLIKGRSIGRSNSYRLNPAYGWKGDNKKAHEYQMELIKGSKS